MSYYPPQVQVSYAPPPASTAHIVIAWLVAVFTGLYMLPWAIAATRSKQNVLSIAMINLFLGWTLVGWVVALVMACSAHQMPTTVLVTNTHVAIGSSPMGWGSGTSPQQYPGQQPYGYPQPPRQLPPAPYSPPVYGPPSYSPPSYSPPVYDPPVYDPPALPARPYDSGYEPTQVLPASQPTAAEVTQPLPPWSREADPYR